MRLLGETDEIWPLFCSGCEKGGVSYTYHKNAVVNDTPLNPYDP